VFLGAKMDRSYVYDFEKLGFGLFVHFGLYSVLGKGEWSKNILKISDNEYDKLIKRFKVKKTWAKELVNNAKKAGCKYITITTRHHDGFSLFDTKGLSDYDVMHSACGRDLIKEFVHECNKGGIVPFFYHTLLDWHVPEYNLDFSKYIDYLVKSVEVLCTSYGKIGGFWFDGMWDKKGADWQEDRLYGTIRKYQPTAMIINNTGLSELGKLGHKELDSVTFERGKPKFVDKSERPVAGEMCQIFNDHWGYAKYDIDYKPVKTLIEDLVDCRKYNCNYLLNVGPCGDGSLRTIDKGILEEIGKWVSLNKGFIYNIKASTITAENADVLTDGEKYYAVIKGVGMSGNPNVTIEMGGAKKVVINAKVTNAKWLDSGKSIPVTDNSFYAEPFLYGTSMQVRVAVLELEI